MLIYRRFILLLTQLGECLTTFWEHCFTNVQFSDAYPKSPYIFM